MEFDTIVLRIPSPHFETATRIPDKSQQAEIRGMVNDRTLGKQSVTKHLTSNPNQTLH